MDLVRRADWLVDVGPHAGERGGWIPHSGPASALRDDAVGKVLIGVEHSA
ncbi:hypothetical protein ACFOSC_12255 [Streptantibioticus rubrisoli]|uniref:Uncharacterized protein n=1 Tax=Streptantibioticus rubrisoli TaxID=1387313 RepID=A0ABT1P8B4_9ACTN|nr:hypothetical protein [Streptantibioticus rubrisoli]MCQ4041597.1 hypothetical protein [Streptantibioticus rubrisoli]